MSAGRNISGAIVLLLFQSSKFVSNFKEVTGSASFTIDSAGLNYVINYFFGLISRFREKTIFLKYTTIIATLEL
jgi:hypothetical protein